MKLADLDINKVYTYADYYKWKFEERIELIKGRIFKMSPAPTSAHQVISREVSGLLWQFLKGKPCQFFSAPFDVRIPRRSREDKDIITVVQPDICVICEPTKIDKKGCIGAPDIVMEILSPSNSEKELKLKYEVYQEAGVREYWVIFPTEKTLMIYTLSDGKFAASRFYVTGDRVSSGVLEGFSFDVNEIFVGYESE
ncbi:hypothetical protein CJD36_012060 [Flavipsychrobacter stenotrophus]|uniref:Putative restriction endonuclease domain-containing protein n=1 Tax=Flavipsychrobacter stenotrophus TaxID=2077091 RepID=A0A2S7SUV8_9BACT|nr:Uma2 family endonuclease [Flavipsychrobacter stenotrophus]PQJ10700.1 hypothetical protein CJD36_012060 [Flavipsychrobacter stenotrophus]